VIGGVGPASLGIDIVVWCQHGVTGFRQTPIPARGFKPVIQTLFLADRFESRRVPYHSFAGIDIVAGVS